MIIDQESFRKLIDEKKAEVAAKKTTAHSYSDRRDITKALLNCPEYEGKNYRADENNNPVADITYPVKEFRSVLAKEVGRAAGLDKEDAENLANNIEFSGNFAKAFNDVSDYAASESLSTGRALKYPKTNPKCGDFKILMYEVPEKTEDTMKIVADENGGHKQVPTGNTVTTEAHFVLKSKNRPAPWQKTVKPTNKK